MAETLEQIIARIPDLSDVDAIHAALTTKNLEIAAYEPPPWLDALPVDVQQKIVAKAKEQKSEADIAGLPEPTKQEIADAIAVVATKRDAGAFWSAVQSQIGLMIDAGNTVDEIKATLKTLSN